MLGRVREDPALLAPDPKKEIRSFRITMIAPLGTKKGRGRGSFIDSIVDLVDLTYTDIVQHLKAWSAAPPRMRESEVDVAQEGRLSSTALSSQDGTQQVIPPDLASDGD